MILLLYGPDTYRSQKKLKQIIACYKATHTSGMSFHVFYGDEADENAFDAFCNTVGSLSMFGEKKLIVIRELGGAKDFAVNFMSWNGKEDLAKSENVVCVFHGYEADKKNPFFLWLMKNAKSQEFAVLGGAQLTKWARQFVNESGIQIDPRALAKLLSFTGGDLWAFENETKKLKHYRRDIIREKDIDVFMRPRVQTHIFALVDAYIDGNKSKAARLLHGHLAAGDNESYLFSMIHSQFRNVAQAQDFLERGECDVARIAYLCSMHPYVAKKSLAQARAFDKTRIKKIYSQLVDLDVSIKAGKREPRAALEELILVS